MIALVTGGARSGKSAYAEDLALSWAEPRARCRYLATMRARDAESRARIARHVRARAGKGFETREVVGDIPRIEGGVALLEDLPNLLASRLYADAPSLGDPEKTCDRIVGDVRRLAACCEGLVVVTGEVGSDGLGYAPETRAYVECLGRIGCEIAGFSDFVVEVVAGCPIEVKRP